MIMDRLCQNFSPLKEEDKIPTFKRRKSSRYLANTLRYFHDWVPLKELVRLASTNTHGLNAVKHLFDIREVDLTLIRNSEWEAFNNDSLKLFKYARKLNASSHPPALNSFRPKRISSDGLKHLKNLTKVDFSDNPTFTDQELQCLASSITEIDLSGCKLITDKGLQSLEKLNHLTDLKLSECKQITDKGLQSLKKLNHLTVLDLSACKLITDEVLQSLEKLNHLTDLNLAGCERITNKGLNHLKHVPKINFGAFDFGAEGCKITDTGLSKLTHVTDLDLSGCKRITGEAFKHLSNITRIDLSDNDVFSTYFNPENLKYLSQVRHIKLSGALGIRDHHLGFFKNLESVHLHDLAITDKAILALTQLEKLKTVTLEFIEDITYQSLTYLMDAKSVTSVTIENYSFSYEEIEKAEKESDKLHFY